MFKLQQYARNTSRRIAAALLSGALAIPALVLAQLPEPLPKPDLDLWTNGSVKAIARASDGSIVFGGNFLAVNGVSRRHIARLRPDGTLDPDWNPGADSSINAIAIDASGAVFVGGFFTYVGDAQRAHIAKLSGSGNGLADPLWNPGADGSVDALALGTNGAIFAGGNFATVDGQARAGLAKLATIGAGEIDPQWNPNVGGSVLSLQHHAAGNALFVGGDFSLIGGVARASIAKLADNGSGVVDPGWDAGSNGIVHTLQLAGSWLYAGGEFDNLASQPHAGVARVDLVGGTGDVNWTPVIGGGDVFSLSVDGSFVYLAGSFIDVNQTLQASLARVATFDGALDSSFNPEINAPVHVVASFGEGVVLIGGPQFTDIDGAVRLGFARLDLNGTPLAATDVLNAGSVYALLPMADGSTLVGGDFYFADSSSRRNLLKLDSAGLLDPFWQPVSDGFVLGLTADPTAARVYAHGTFLIANGVERPSLARFSTSGGGALDATWNPAPSGSVRAVAASMDGWVYVGGTFDQVGGGARARIARLSSVDAALDAAWNPAGADGDVSTLALDPRAGGQLFASGVFGLINGQARAGLAKIDPATGVVDPDWMAGLNDQRAARSIVFIDNDIYIGGGFDSVAGLPRANLAKISIASPAVVDPNWAPNANAEVEQLTVGTDAAIFAVGGFTMIDAQPRSRIAKLSSSGSVDSAWAPLVFGSYVSAVAIDTSGRVVFGGYFNQVGSAPRQSIAALPQHTLDDALFADGFE